MLRACMHGGRDESFIICISAESIPKSSGFPLVEEDQAFKTDARLKARGAGLDHSEAPRQSLYRDRVVPCERH